MTSQPPEALMQQFLKAEFNQRFKQLQSMFVSTIQKIEDSEILRELKGPDYIQLRAERILQTIRISMASEKEKYIEELLKAVASLRRELALKEKPDEAISRLRLQHQREIMNLKKEVQASLVKRPDDVAPPPHQLAEELKAVRNMLEGMTKQCSKCKLHEARADSLERANQALEASLRSHQNIGPDFFARAERKQSRYSELKTKYEIELQHLNQMIRTRSFKKEIRTRKLRDDSLLLEFDSPVKELSSGRKQ